MRSVTYICLMCGLLMLASCHRVKPQSASNKVQEVDSAAIAMTMVNMRLAEEADRECTAYVQQADTAFTLDEFGYWYTLTRRTDGEPIKKDDKVRIIYQTYRMTGEMIEDTESLITVGRREVMVAIDDLLTFMREGEEAKAVAPYYTAYGKDGKGKVEPCTNCIIFIRQITLEQ